MRRKALLSVILSVAMILGSVSPAFAAGEMPSDEVTVSSESQDEVGIEDDSKQESVDNQEAEEVVETESESEEDGIVDEIPDEESKPEADTTDSTEEEEEKPETLVGAEGERVSVGENVTAEFDSETGTVTFYSQGGTLSRDWKESMDIKGTVNAITISDDSDVMYLPADSHSLFGYSSAQSINLSKADTSNVTDMSYMFNYCQFLQTLDVSGFNTSNVTDMSYMFCRCWNLQTLNISGFDTSNVTDMSNMFYCCSSQALDVSGFDTSNVTDMSNMFYHCSSQALDVSGFDTSNVTDMSSMFEDCNKLQTLNISRFNTLNVTDMSYMFKDCNSLQTLDVSGFNTSNVTDMSYMFCRCWNLQTLDISGFDTSNVTDMSYLFEYCSSLQTLNVSGFNTSNVTSMESMFEMCCSLQRLDLSSFDMKRLYGVDGFLSDNNNLLEIITPVSLHLEIDLPGIFVDDSGTEYFFLPEGLSESICLTKKTAGEGVSVGVGVNVTAGFDSETGIVTFYSQGGTLSRDWLTRMGISKDTVKAITISNDSDVMYLPEDCNDLFYDFENLQSLNLSKADTSNVTDMSKMFYYCSSLQALDVSGFDTSNVTDMSYMFSYCTNFQALDVSGFDTSNVTDMSNMFYHCSSQALDVSGFDTSNVRYMDGMFDCCENLQTLDVSGFDTSNVTDMSAMFMFCSSLQSLDVSGFDTSRVRDMTDMFDYCESLQTLDVSGFDTSNVLGMHNMFANCSSLQELDVSNFDITSVTPYSMVGGCAEMFYGCSSLQRLDLSSFDMDILKDSRGMLTCDNNLLEIMTPVNVHFTVELPGTFVDATGKVYHFLPEGLSESICLTKKSGEQSEERVSVGENVTAGFDSETGTLTFYSQGGTLSRDWESMMDVEYQYEGDIYYVHDYVITGINGRAIEKITISDDSDVMYLPTDCSGLFQKIISLKTLDLSKADTSNVTDMSDMFYKCRNLQTIDVSGFNTSNVTNMREMFGECCDLQTLDVSGFNTSNVTNMIWMFGRCSNLLVLMTPVNVNVTANLPDTYIDASGTEYNSLPEGLSESIRLTRKGAVIPAELEILSLSDDYYGKKGTPASFHIEAEGSGTVTYQWQYRTAGTTSWKTPSQASAKTADYVFNLRPSYDNIEVRCIVSDEFGNEIISETRKANVFAYTLQPKDATASEGQAVNFEVSAIGRGITYQWYYKRPNSTWKKAAVSGSKTAVLPITAGTKNDGTSYRCVITDEEGNKITSAAGTLMLETPLQITGMSEDAYDVNGKNVTFHIDAVGNGDLSYQWQYRLAGETKWRTPGLASAKTADYVFKLRPSYDNIEVRCIVKDASGNSVTSDVRKANVFAITSQPQDTELALGEKTTFAVEAVGRELTYQWYYMRPEGSWKKVIVAGYNTLSLVITANTKNDGTKFRCRITDGLGNILVSSAALLTQK